MLGYNLKNIETIEYDLNERHVTLRLRYLTYRLHIDDIEKLKQLIKVLNLFLKARPKKDSDVYVPDFYSEQNKPSP
jgi:hypothetical protein